MKKYIGVLYIYIYTYIYIYIYIYYNWSPRPSFYWTGENALLCM